MQKIVCHLKCFYVQNKLKHFEMELSDPDRHTPRWLILLQKFDVVNFQCLLRDLEN